MNWQNCQSSLPEASGSKSLDGNMEHDDQITSSLPEASGSKLSGDISGAYTEHV